MPQHIVSDNDDGIRLDRWFKRHEPNIPHSLLEKHLRKGAIRLDGKKAKSSDRIQAGQKIDVRIEDPAPRVHEKKTTRKPLTPEDISMVQSLVLYKDANIIVVNKPFGLPVQGGTKIARSLDDLLDGLTFDGERPKLTHRLDRDTSGCLVLARTSKSATALMRLFSSRRIEKTYLALVNNLPDPLKGTIDQPLIKKENPRAMGMPSGPEGRDYEIMTIDEEEGQRAITDYRVIDMLARKFALVELQPLTGRTHQLRVHMASIGCPILGDHKYGGANDAAKSIGVENVLHLHAWKIGIPPIAGGKPLEVRAPLPSHMQQSFRALGIDVPKN
jgi:23S rRNA pseudouridine955/2504/2580 synthase